MSNRKWAEVIEPRTGLLDLRLDEVWRYRDLVMMFVRRDFVTNYKQTILGPLWFFIQPILVSLTYVLIFGRVAGLAPNNVPPLVFYLSGITIWNYFSECLTKTATVFKDNAQIFGKVYFPRLTMPLSIVIANLVKFGIQFLLFLAVWLYYFVKEGSVHLTPYILLVPVAVVLMGVLALGLGMIISAMTTKYKDLILLLSFGVQLLMFATPIIYSMSSPFIANSKFKWLILANPVTAIVEVFRYAFTGVGEMNWGMLGYSAAFTLVALFIGTIVFNRVQKRFTDTV